MPACGQLWTSHAGPSMRHPSKHHAMDVWLRRFGAGMRELTLRVSVCRCSCRCADQHPTILSCGYVHVHDDLNMRSYVSIPTCAMQLEGHDTVCLNPVLRTVTEAATQLQQLQIVTRPLDKGASIRIDNLVRQAPEPPVPPAIHMLLRQPPPCLATIAESLTSLIL